MTPLCSQTPRSQVASTAARSWETKTRVVPWASTAPIRSRHFFWKAAPPPPTHPPRARKGGGGEEGAHPKAEPHLHAARVELHLPVDRMLDLGEADDVVEATRHLTTLQAEQRAIEVDVLAAGG